MIKFFFYYMLAVNLLAFCLYGIDKKNAIKKRWRISETVLLSVAFAGGSIGAWTGMMAFRHKTKHRHFKILIPACFAMQAAGVLYICMN